MNALGPSWKPKVAGILTPIVPVLLWMLLTQAFKLSESTATEISGAVLGALVSYGLINAKASNVSNSPTPLAVSQAVATAPVIAVAPVTDPGAHPETVANPAAVPAPHLIS